MQDKKTRWLCILNIIFVLISGIYLDEIRLESVRTDAELEQMDACQMQSDMLLLDESDYKIEITGLYENKSIHHAVIRNGNYKKDTRIQLGAIALEAFSVKAAKTYARLDENVLLANCQKQFVIIYMQQSDGKKRV